MSKHAIEIKQLEFTWRGSGARLTIDRLAIERGEKVFLSGASGSGKSTLLGLISGLMIPDKGSIEVIGATVNALKPAGRDRFRGDHIGYIFQMFNLVPYLTVHDNILLPLRFSSERLKRLKGVPPAVEASRLLAALGLGLGGMLDRSVLDLSIGQQQRVAAARALIGRPEILMADEPTSSLDADSRADFLRLLLDECRAAGATLLFVSHDVSLKNHFDRAIAMTDLGRISSCIA